MLACIHATLLKLCLTLCKPMDCSSPGFSVHRILQAGILEWVAIPFSRGSYKPTIEPTSLVSPALAGVLFTSSASGKPTFSCFSSVQSLSRVRLCDPMDCSTPGLPVHHQLLELAQTHVHQVHDAIQLSHPLLFPSPLAFKFSQHWGLFQ